ncbi:MAG: hypothetical protein M5R41_07310 [Bacteroidia bacterium]|nr:hypothetical protein [Bacteroidia bacterium]
MKLSDTTWRIAAFALSVLSSGLPYWVVPYSQVSLPTTLIAPGLLVAAFAAMLLVTLRKAFWLSSVLLIGSALPFLVLLRVIVEAIMDPTSHNLWPFELIIAALLGLLTAGVGAVAGWFVVRLRERREAA